MIDMLSGPLQEGGRDVELQQNTTNVQVKKHMAYVHSFESITANAGVRLKEKNDFNMTRSMYDH